MLDTVPMPRSDFSVNHRGAYQAGSWKRSDREGEFWGCTCVNCGEVFSNRRKLRVHYTKCMHFEDTHEALGENIKINKFICFKCGVNFCSKRKLGYHSQRCGQYQNMQEVAIVNDEGLVINETEKEKYEDKTYDVVVIVEEKEHICKNQEEVVLGAKDTKAAEKVEDKRYNGNSGKVVAASEKNALLVKGDFEDNVESEHADNVIDDAGRVKINEYITNSVKVRTELLKESTATGRIKRKYDVMFSAASEDLLEAKKLKIADAPLYKSLREDIQQERRHNLFDRVSGDQKSYKCPKCNVRFKYKQKFDIHVKYAHAPTEKFIAEAIQTDVAEEPKIENSETSNLTRNDDSSNRINVKSPRETPFSFTSATSSVKLEMANYPCEFCYMSFRHYSRYQRHLKSVHRELKERDNLSKCPECNKKLPDKYALLNHYKCMHAGNSAEGEKETRTKSSTVVDVNDVMKYLRRNLLCLQDDRNFETDKTGNCSETARNSRDISKYSNGSDDNIMSRESESNSESRDSNVSSIDESRHKLEMQEKDNIAWNKDDIRYHQTTCDVNENVPLDLSFKLEKPSVQTYDTPIDINDEEITVVDKKPSEYEKSLIMEYYKDFLQECGIK